MTANLDLTQLSASQNNKETTVNNITAQIDGAITDTYALTSTGGTVTLTEAEWLLVTRLLITGTLTSNLLIKTPNTNKKWAAVSNQTSGAYTVTVEPPTGTGTAVTQGQAALLYCDGTNMIDFVTIPGAVTATVSQGGTGVTTLAAHGVLVGNGTSNVNVTSAGTANYVFQSNGASADPTFVSTITGLTLSGCTFSGATTFPNGGGVDANGTITSEYNVNASNWLKVYNNSTGNAATVGIIMADSGAFNHYAFFGLIGSGFSGTGIKQPNSAYFVAGGALAIVGVPVQFSVDDSGFAECARIDTNGFLLVGYTTSNSVSCDLQIASSLWVGGTIFFDGASFFSTGSTTCTLGTNSPATGTTPHKWWKIVEPDGTASYIPVFR